MYMLSTTVTVLVFVSLAEGGPGQGLQAAQPTELNGNLRCDQGSPVRGTRKEKGTQELCLHYLI